MYIIRYIYSPGKTLYYHTVLGEHRITFCNSMRDARFFDTRKDCIDFCNILKDRYKFIDNLDCIEVRVSEV